MISDTAAGPTPTICASSARLSKGSTRDSCWEWPCCGQKPGSGRIRLGGTLQGSSPAEIVGQVARSDALEACHPALQPTVVGVHVLDVKGAVADADAGGEVDRLVVQPGPGGEDGVGFGPIRAEHRIAGDQGRALLRREPALAGALAPPVGTSLEGFFGSAPSSGPFVRAAKKGLVGLDHAC